MRSSFSGSVPSLSWQTTVRFRTKTASHRKSRRAFSWHRALSLTCAKRDRNVTVDNRIRKARVIVNKQVEERSAAGSSSILHGKHPSVRRAQRLVRRGWRWGPRDGNVAAAGVGGDVGLLSKGLESTAVACLSFFQSNALIRFV
jgi:hypothetical protein